MFSSASSCAPLYVTIAHVGSHFAAQHHPPLGCEPFAAAKFMFRAAAGLYLAGLFFYRGFGIAAGCHAFYNVIVVTLEAVGE